jgi:DNA-binding cell septation regulator SpoVG
MIMPAVAMKQPYAFVLREDAEAESPRKANDNFGKMVCFHPRHRLGDEHDHKEPEDFLRDLAQKTVTAKAICDFAAAARDGSVRLTQNQESGGWTVTARYFKEWEAIETFTHPLAGQEDAVADLLLNYMDTAALLRLAKTESVILPLYLYDHSGLSMSTSDFADRWDSGQVGWIYVTKTDAVAALGETDNGVFSITKELLESEVSEYDSYLRGDCYGFQLYENGIEVDSCWGFIGSPEALKADIESHLPDACKGVMDNLVYLNTDREVDGFLLEQERQPIYMEGDPIMSNTEHAAPIHLEARAYPFAEPKGKQLAFASVTINDAFAVTGVKIMDGGEKGPFVAMPSAKDREGNFKDICFPTTKELRAQISAVVMDAYNAAVEKGLTDRAAQKDTKEPERASATDKLEKAKEKAAKAPKTPKAEKPAPSKDTAL